MMDNRLLIRIRDSASPIPMPISTYPGLPLTGARITDVLSDPRAQADTQLALHEKFRTHALLSPMDLSAEAEAFGSEILFREHEIPSVARPLVATEEDVRRLAVPAPGDKRTAVHLASVRLLRAARPDAVVIGGAIGPFSLASQLVGLTELMMLCLTSPQLVHAIVEKTTAFLGQYATAFCEAGADAVLMAEPVAGLVSPADLGRFSSANVRTIREVAETPSFRVFLHNCSARLAHLPRILDAGASFYHLGAPMDLPAALTQVPPGVVVAGNLHPVEVFFHGTAELVAERTAALMRATAGCRNFVPSSGCDLPPGTPLSNLQAFYQAVAGAAPAQAS